MGRWRAAVVSLIGMTLGLGGAACTLPSTSFARPVSPMPGGNAMVSTGVMVPALVAGDGPNDDAEARAFEPFAVLPFVAGDTHIGERLSLGLSGATVALLGSDANSNTLGTPVLLVPRLEYRDGALAFTLDLTVWPVRGGWSGLGVFPSAGVRYYRSFGDSGGLVLTQQFGSVFFATSLPGSVAWDIPLVTDGVGLHLFPEVRWDPSYLSFDSEDFLAVVIVSVGLSVMLEF